MRSPDENNVICTYLGAFCILLAACGGSTPETKSPANEASSAPVANAATEAPAAGAPDKQRERLEAAGGVVKTNLTPPGKSERYGRAEAIVHAPIDDLRKAVLDFSNYKSLAPDKFKTARLIAKEDGHADVYFQVPVMKGLMTIWYVTRFPVHPTKLPNGAELVDGKFVKGSIEDMELSITMRAVAPDETILSIDLLIVPQIPAPQSALDETFRDAAGDAVEALKKRVEPKPTEAPQSTAAPEHAAPPQPAAAQPATP